METKMIRLYKKARSYGSPAWIALDLARRWLPVGEKSYCDKWPWDRGLYNVSWQPNDRGVAYIDNPESAGLRFVGHADELARLNHQGWITNPDIEDEDILRGGVWQLPGRNGNARYVAGYTRDVDGGGAMIDLGCIYETRGDDITSEQRSVAIMADGMAERAAEKEREYNEQWQAGCRWSDLADQIARTRRDLLELLAEMRLARLRGESSDAICSTLRRAVESMLDAMRKLREERAELFHAYGSSDGFAEHLPRA